MKDCFTPECLAHVEARLRQYPKQQRELAELDRHLSSCVHSGGGIVHAGDYSGNELSEPERVMALKESDPRYMGLRRSIDAVDRALSGLTRKQRAREFIRLRYWQGLAMAEIAEAWHVTLRSLWHYRQRLFSKFVPVLFPTEGL